MKSATSLLNRKLLNHFMSGIFWLSVLYLIGNILVQPFVLWVISSGIENPQEASYLPESAMSLTTPYSLAGGMLYVVLMVTYLFKYKNSEDSIDFMHSLPLKRAKIMTHALLAGLINITVPLFITAGILFLTRYALVFEITVSQIAVWLLYSIFVLFIVFAVSVFAGFLVNNLFVHLQMVVIVFFLPMVFWMLTVGAAGVLFDGMPVTALSVAGSDSDIISVVVDNTFPVFAILQIYEGFAMWKMAVWLIIALLLITGAYGLYQRHQSENVHYNFNHRWIRHMLSALIAITGMLTVGMIISTLIPDSLIVKIIGFAIGLVISYIIIEMFFQGTARIGFDLRSLIITSVIVILFWTVFIIGWQQYTNYVPASDRVESVSVNDNSSGNYGPGSESVGDDFLYTDDQETISRTLEIHDSLLDSNLSGGTNNRYNAVEIEYQLDDGSSVHRRFTNIDTEEEGYEALTQLMNSSEMRRSNDIVNNLDAPENAESMRLEGADGMVSLTELPDIIRYVRDYQTALNDVDLDAPAITHNTAGEFAGTSVTFNENNTYSGDASIYNQALIDTVSEQQNLSDFIGMNYTGQMYVVSLSDLDQEIFYEDFSSLPSSDFIEEYDLELAADEEKDEIINSVNQGNIDESSDQLLIFEGMHTPQFYNDPASESTAADEFAILGLDKQ